MSGAPVADGSYSVREAVRVLVVGPQDQILLLRLAFPGQRPFWTSPGGGVEPGETHADAVRRELAEEVGLRAVPADLPHVWDRCTRWAWPDGRRVEQRERWYLLRVPSVLQPDVAGWTDEEREVIREVRWWTLGELAASGTGRHHTPGDLPVRLPALLAADRAGTLPDRPEEVGE